MSKTLVTNDGFFIDDAGQMIQVVFADLRHPSEQLPVKALIKGCRTQYAIELYKKIRISKPSRFRQYGESLIMDPLESYASRTVENAWASNDPSQLQATIDEVTEEVGLAPGSVKVTGFNMESSLTTTDSHTLGKNGWIFSTSIAPTNQEEHEAWQKSIPEEYDHVSYIYRPREFARALGSMVVEQLGSQGQEVCVNHTFDGRELFQTYHPHQLVLHGPVTYEEAPYELIDKADSGIELMIRSVFVKGLKYRDQREYRFVVWSENEPADEVVDLEVSLAMLGAMHETAGINSLTKE